MAFENYNNLEEITLIKHISYVIRRTIRLCWDAIKYGLSTCNGTRICDATVHAIVPLFIEGFLLCAFLAVYDYAPQADARKHQNSVVPYLNGESNSLPVTYTCKSKIFTKTRDL